MQGFLFKASYSKPVIEPAALQTWLTELWVLRCPWQSRAYSRDHERLECLQCWHPTSRYHRV